MGIGRCYRKKEEANAQVDHYVCPHTVVTCSGLVSNVKATSFELLQSLHSFSRTGLENPSPRSHFFVREVGAA